MESKLKKMTIKEFREQGYLQELNRQFLHPLGLAIAVNIDEAGNETIQTIYDFSDDPEGIYFGDSVVTQKTFKDNAVLIGADLFCKKRERIKARGYVVQPYGEQGTLKQAKVKLCKN